MLVVAGVVIHRAVVHARLPFRRLENAAVHDGRLGPFVAAPLEQSVAIAVAPGLPVAAVFEPPLVPLPEARISPLQHGPVTSALVDFPDAVRTHRRLRSIGS